MALPYEPPSPPARTGTSVASPPARKPPVRKAAPTSLLQTALDAALAPVDTSAYNRVANAQAKATIASQLAAYHAEQAQALAQARQQAQQIGLASQAAADYLKPLGDKTAQDWANAVASQAGVAQGFTGQLRSDAEQAAQQAQAQIAGSGSGAQVNDQSASLANLLYGLSGQLPANVLTAQGLGATQAARALPGQTLAYGQQEAVGALGQGNLAAQQFAPDIAKAIGSQPQLQQQYLSDLVKQATDTQQNRANALFKAVSANQAAQNAQSLQDWRSGQLTIAKKKAADLQAYNAKKIAIDQQKANNDATYKNNLLTLRQQAQDASNAYHSGMLSVAQYNAKVDALAKQAAEQTRRYNAATSRLNAKTAAANAKITAAKANAPEFITASDGSKVVVTTNPDGSLTFQNAPGKLGKPKASAASSIPQGLLRSAEKIAQIAHDGTFDSVGNQIIPPQKNRAVALRRVMATLRAGGVKRKDAVRVAPAILIGAGYPPPQPKGVQTAGVGSAVTDWVAALTGQPVPNPTPGNLFG